MQIFLLLALVFAIIIAVFAGYNTNTADINFLFWQAKGVPISIVILTSAFVGAFFTALIGFYRILRGSLAARSDHKKITEQQAKLTELQESNTRLQGDVTSLQKENEQLLAKISSSSQSEGGSVTTSNAISSDGAPA